MHVAIATDFNCIFEFENQLIIYKPMNLTKWLMIHHMECLLTCIWYKQGVPKTQTSKTKTSDPKKLRLPRIMKPQTPKKLRPLRITKTETPEKLRPLCIMNTQTPQNSDYSVSQKLRPRKSHTPQYHENSDPSVLWNSDPSVSWKLRTLCIT